MAVREVIIPLKKHLVKYLDYNINWRNKFEFSSKKYLYEYKAECDILITIELIVPDLLNEKFTLLSGTAPKAGTEVVIVKNLPIKSGTITSQFSVEKFQFIKLKIYSNFSPYTEHEKKELRQSNYRRERAFVLLNNILESSFRHYMNKLIYGNSPSKKLDELFKQLGLQETEIKKSSLLSYYQRYRQKEDETKYQKKFHNFDREKLNEYFFNIIKDHENEYSFSQIAKKNKTSKTTVQRICKNPLILQEYKKYIKRKKRL